MNGYTGKPELTTMVDVENNGFFPDLAMADLVKTYRIPSEYDNDVIKNGLMLAMIEVNRQLAIATAVLADYQDLQSYCDANPEQIAGQDVLIIKYQEAVFCNAKAFLLQQFKTMNRKPEAENMAKEAPETEQYWIARSYAAINFILQRLGIVATAQSPICYVAGL
jgi:Phage head completion protein (GPL)